MHYIRMQHNYTVAHELIDHRVSVCALLLFTV